MIEVRILSEELIPIPRDSAKEGRWGAARCESESKTHRSIYDLIDAIKAGYKSQNNKQLNKSEQITEKDLDNFIKLVAETGLYEIRDGKVYKKTESWVELV